MRLLLDTHALLWWLNDDEKLGDYVRHLIIDPEIDVLGSTVSLWKIKVKLLIGKLDADIGEILAPCRARVLVAWISPTSI